MHENDWQSHLQQQYDGRFYERLQETWGNEWSTRLDIVLQGNNDTGLIEQIRNESYTLQVGNKRYELSNHLGNVLAVVSDKKEQSDGVTWSAVVLSATDYYPFGMAMPGRSTTSTYKYGFNGQEKDTEIGEGIYTAEFWEYDARIGRRFNVDPITFPWQSPYATFNNNPIALSDPSGALSEDPVKKKAPNELDEVVITGKNESSKPQPLVVQAVKSLEEQKNPNEIKGNSGTFNITINRPIPNGHKRDINHRGYEFSFTYACHNPALKSQDLGFIQIEKITELNGTTRYPNNTEPESYRLTVNQDGWVLDRHSTKSKCSGWYGTKKTWRGVNRPNGVGYFFKDGNPVFWDMPGSGYGRTHLSGISLYQVYVVNIKTGIIYDGMSWGYKAEMVSGTLMFTQLPQSILLNYTPEFKEAVEAWNLQTKLPDADPLKQCAGQLPVTLKF